MKLDVHPLPSYRQQVLNGHDAMTPMHPIVLGAPGREG